MDPTLLPAHGAHLHLSARDDLSELELILDIQKGILHVLRDDGVDRWEGRGALPPLDRVAWGRRLAGLGEGSDSIVTGQVGRLAWQHDGGEAPGTAWAAPIHGLRSHSRQGPTAFARDLCALAIQSRIDHPLAAGALNRWNQELNFAATVQFWDGSPRRVRLIGMVDPSGLSNLRALASVLATGEALVFDVRACASLGTWDPSPLIADHPVAWVGARGGVADNLHDQGVPREAFHETERAARAWLRG